MFGSDFRYAWRALTHQKLGSGLVVLMLALGIGANVAVFSLVNGLFLRPLPFPESRSARLPERNRAALEPRDDRPSPTRTSRSGTKAQQAFESIAIFNERSFNIATDSGSDRMDGASVSADFAKVLGVEPVIGRMFTAEEDRPNGPQRST